jgi:hypothetical protein
VFDLPADDISDRFDAAVGMPGKSFDVMFRVTGTEIIEEQERIEGMDLTKTEGPL